MYLMVSTRPDLSFAVSYLARYLNCYDKEHFRAAMLVLRYVQATKDDGITYHAGKDLELVGYSDSDWASDVNTRRSTTGYLFLLAGGAISWKTRLQPTVANSSTEAEYMALSAAAQEALALRDVCREFNIDVTAPTVIFEDNQGALAMAKNPLYYAKTKHIHIKYHFTREKVRNGDIVVVYKPTVDMLADAMTKGLARDRYIMLKKQYMA
jgi:hypothetical protein